MLLTLSDLWFHETVDDVLKRLRTPPSKQLDMPIAYGCQSEYDGQGMSLTQGSSAHFPRQEGI